MAKNLTIRPRSSVYKNYLKSIWVIAVVVIVLAVLRLTFERNDGFLWPLLYIAILILGSIVFAYYYIKHASLELTDSELVYHRGFRTRRIATAQVKQVIFAGAFVTMSTVPLTRLFIERQNGKLFKVSLVNSGFYEPADIEAMAQAVAKQAGAHCHSFNVFTSKQLSQLMPKAPGYLTHPFRTAMYYVVGIVLLVIVVAAIAAGLSSE